MSASDDRSSRLDRRLGTADAVVLGLGSMLGAGVFAAYAPAAEAAGAGLLLGLGLAALVAYCNAASSAQLAAVYPESGGTYVYGRRRLGAFWGFLAGWGFVVGKIASCAAMAFTFGAYVAPGHPRLPALAALAALTAVNYRGVRKTLTATRVIVAIVLTSLALIVAAALSGGTDWGALASPFATDAYGVLQSAGLLFFAFAGYARIATLGEEVRDPARTIPRAIPLALGITLGVYAVVAVAALLALGPVGLGRAAAPLASAAGAGSLEWAVPAARVGGAVAALGALLSLIAGVSRTGFAMAANRELPAYLGAVHPRYRVPHRAEVTAALAAGIVVLAGDLRSAIGFSAFTVLVYYAIANVSAWTLPPEARRWPRFVPVVGAAGCAALAFALPVSSVIAGASVVAAGAALWLAAIGRQSGGGGRKRNTRGRG